MLKMFGEKVTFFFLLMPYVYHKASQNECVVGMSVCWMSMGNLLKEINLQDLLVYLH